MLLSYLTRGSVCAIREAQHLDYVWAYGDFRVDTLYTRDITSGLTPNTDSINVG